jgi:hypothetical protein
MPHRFGFFPHARNSVAANAQVSGTRLSSAFDVAIMGDGSQQGSRLAIDATLRGPGDVIGISSDQIARYEPAPGQRGFEPNYFPFVEFVDVDFPWRYSLQTGSPKRLSPWLALIALKDEEFDLVSQGRGPLPRLMVHSIADSLPNLNQAWAWAHVQVNLDGAGSKTMAEQLADDPGNGFARLFCCRKLDERTRYHLFVVPVYEAGRLVGLGSDISGAGSGFAWQSGANESVELPYYSRSELVTDASADIEQLVRKLRAFKADEGDEAGAPANASADRPGYYDDYLGNRQRFEIQTALMQADGKVQRYNTDQPLAQRMAGTLTEVIAGEGDDPDEDPLVAFPPYGFRFRQETEVSLQKARNGRWFDRVNLDLKMRHAAARGAVVVRENQEEYAKAAWDQYATVMEANQKLRQLRLAEKLAERLTIKHLHKLPSDVVTVLAEPMQPYVRIAQSGKAVSITKSLSGNGSPGAYASRGLRRVAAKRPVKAVQQNEGTQIPSPAIKGDVSPSPISVRKADAAVVTSPANVFSGLRLTGLVAQHYTAMFGAGVLGAKPNKTEMLVREFDSVAFSAAVADTMRALPRLKGDFIVKGRTKDEQKTLDPLWRSPRIPLPMAPALTDIARDAILPNVGDLPDNTVSLFVENRHYIEAFMVGVNHAMNDELRWREFPTDMRGTIFDRFWDRGAALEDAVSADISGIDTWTKRLGSNRNPANPDGNEAMVIVIKGDIVRKLGDPIIVVNEHSGSSWAPGTGTDFEPVFFGKMGRETAYFGFDLNREDVFANPDAYRLVIYEPMGRLRFGLDVGSAKVRQQRQNVGELSLNFPMKHRDLAVNTLPIQPKLVSIPALDAIPDWDDLSWNHMGLSSSGYINFTKTVSTQNGADLWGGNKTSASLARSFWQKPVAAVLPFTRVLP